MSYASGAGLGTISLAQVYAGLQYAEHQQWTGETVTYSIPTATSVWSPGSYAPDEEPFNADYGIFNDVQADSFRLAVFLWDRVTALSLIEAPDNANSQGQIRIAFTDVDDYTDEAFAYAYRPPEAGQGGDAYNGDIWIDADAKEDEGDFGGYLFVTLLHELGHTLGLKHPFEDTRLPGEFDNSRYTVMSYTDFEDSRLRFFYVENGEVKAATYFVQPATPMPLDILAIQGIYGVSTDTALGDTIYAYNGSPDYISTLLDNGGTDTLNLSRMSLPSVVNLTPGEFSSIGYYSIAAQIADWTRRYPDSEAMIRDYLSRAGGYTGSNNLAIDINTVIENVLGGAGDDTVTGNSAANSMSGGGGSDRLFGGLGADTLDGGTAGAAGNYVRGDEGDDSLSGGSDFDDINGNMGNDTVSTGAGDDFCVGGKDSDLLFGDDGGDFVYGNLGDDTCDGGAGNDTVRGGQGADTLAGGAGDDFVSGDRGDDTMVGGAGADIFHSSSDAGIDRVLDFSLADGDRVLLDPGTTYSVSQVGGDTVIQMSAGQVVLVGVTMSSLPAGTIFGA